MAVAPTWKKRLKIPAGCSKQGRGVPYDEQGPREGLVSLPLPYATSGRAFNDHTVWHIRRHCT